MKLRLMTQKKALYPMLKVPVVDHTHQSAKRFSVHTLLVFSYLMFLDRKGTGARVSRICHSLVMDPATVRRHLGVLSSCRLAKSNGNEWSPLPPDDEFQGLFKRLPRPRRIEGWWDYLVYDRLHLPTKRAISKGFTHAANHLYWRLVRWARRVQNGGGVIGPSLGSKVSRLSAVYLSTAMNSDRRTIAGNLDKLRKCGLIATPKLYGHFFGVGIVPHSDKHLALWRERWQKPCVVPTVAAYFANGANELLVQEHERSFAKILCQYGIESSIQEKIVSAAEGLGISDSDFALLVKQTDNDHRGNLFAGKVQVVHCGYLLLKELTSRLTVAAARKAASAGYDRDEQYWDERRARDTLADVMRLLSVRNQCCELLRQVVGKATISVAGGTDEPISLTWTHVKESLNESQGDLDRFKNSIAAKLFCGSLSSPEACPWLHAWRKLRPVPRPDYEMLQQRFQPNPQKEHLFSVVQEEIDKWAYANSKDDADAQTNANLLAAAIAERCSPNGERISYESYTAAKKVLLESGQLAFV